MRQMIAKARIEVSGVVYLPGDPFLCNDAQRDFLKGENAAVDDPKPLVSVTPQLRAGATIEEHDDIYRRVTGQEPPKKGKKEKVK